MAKRKFLAGELNFVEGTSTIKEFLKTFATKIIRQNWIPYDRLEEDIAWAFDVKREIWLREEFKSSSIKLYKATLNDKKEYVKGDLIPDTQYIIIKNIIRGTGDNNSGTQINDRVLIEVTYEDIIFQQSTILDEILPSGQKIPHATLKSRPQGDIRICEEQIQLITQEPLHQEGGSEFYLFGKSPISRAKDSPHTVTVYKNGIEVDDEEYVVDYWNGILMFRSPQTSSDKITATYGFKTGIRETNPDGSYKEIPKEKYKRNRHRIIDITPNQELKNKDIIIDVDYYWDLHYPERVEDITDRIIIKTKVDVSRQGDRFKLKEYFVEMKYMDYEQGNESKDYKTGILVRFGSKLKHSITKTTKSKQAQERNTLDANNEVTLDDNLSSAWAKFSWYKNNCFDDGVIFEDWLPIRFALNFTKEYMNIFIQGDPSPDFGTIENHYIMGYAYFGMLEEYENTRIEDLENNFAMTVSSGEPPELENNTQWGVKTGNGITDVVMERTASNIPYQGHNVSFHTTPEFMDKTFITSSNFTGCHHFSKVTVVHQHERERGMLQGILVGDKSAMFHLDELTHNKDEFDLRGALTDGFEVRDKYGFPFESKETKWLHINNNAPYSFFNNSPNAVYGIALRKE